MLLSLFRPGLHAIRAFWKPFVLIQICGLLVVIGYFYVPFVRDVLDRLGEFKAAGGVAIVIIASAISGAVVPELAKIVALGQTHFDRTRLNDLAINGMIFGLFGFAGDAFYTLMGELFPPDGTMRPIVIKTALDQALYSPFLTLPFVALVYTFRRHAWRIKPVLNELGFHWYLTRVLTLAVMCWCYWVPMCLLMYTLPAGLTFVFAMFGQAAWALLLLFAAKHGADPASHDEPIPADLPVSIEPQPPA